MSPANWRDMDALQSQVVPPVSMEMKHKNFNLMKHSVLDPILFDLLDPSIRRIPNTAKVRGKELHGFLYERPFDQRYANHLLEMLLSIIRFGGQGFAKTARSTSIKRSHHAGLIQRVETGKDTADMNRWI